MHQTRYEVPKNGDQTFLLLIQYDQKQVLLCAWLGQPRNVRRPIQGNAVAVAAGEEGRQGAGGHEEEEGEGDGGEDGDDLRHRVGGVDRLPRRHVADDAAPREHLHHRDHARGEDADDALMPVPIV